MKIGKYFTASFVMTLLFCLLIAGSAYAGCDETSDVEVPAEVDTTVAETPGELNMIVEETSTGTDEVCIPEAEPELPDTEEPAIVETEEYIADDANVSEAKHFISFDGKYKLYLGESACLEEILESLGIDISGGISAVTCSNPEVIVPEQSGNGYVLTSTGKAFNDEFLIVTIGGVENTVQMHDPDEYRVNNSDDLSYCLQNHSDSNIVCDADIVLSDGISTDAANTLDLNGHALTADADITEILKIDYTGNLKIIDSSKDKTGKIDFNSKPACIANYGFLSLEGITLMNYCNDTGDSAIKNIAGTLTVEDCIIQNCKSKEGGAIYVDGGIADIRNSTFTGCSANGGGAIYVSGGAQLLMYGVTFENCSAGNKGGALYFSGNGVLAAIDKTTATGCSASSDGGAVFNDNGVAYFRDSTFTDCSSDSNGGAICLSGSSHVELNSVTIKDCRADCFGGAVFFDGSTTLDITGKTTITGCSALSGGIKSNSTKSLLNIHGDKSNAIVITGNTTIHGVLDDINTYGFENILVSGTFTQDSRIGMSGYIIHDSSLCYVKTGTFEGNLDTVFFSDDPHYSVSYEYGVERLFYNEINEETNNTIVVIPITDRYVYGSGESVSFYTNSKNDGAHPEITIENTVTNKYEVNWTDMTNGVWYVEITCLDYGLPEVAGSHSVTVTGSDGQMPATLTYWVRPREVSLEWIGDSFSYDGQDHAPTVVMTGVVERDIPYVRVKLAEGSTGKDVGNYTATAILYYPRSANYALPDNYRHDFTITDDGDIAPTAFPNTVIESGGSGTSDAFPNTGIKSGGSGTSDADAGKSLNVSYVVTTSDKNCWCDVRIFGTTAEILVKDADGNAVCPKNVTIVSTAALVSDGVRTAKIRLTDSLTLEIDLVSAMGGKKDCIITIDIKDGIIVVKCDDRTIFEADMTELADRMARIVYDGKTVKAIDSNGRVIAEFELS